MRTQVNLVVDADVRRLDAPLPPMRARAGCSFVLRIGGVPGDCAGVVVRVSTDGGEGFMDFPATCDANGEWTCRILGVAFRRPGAEWYEVRAGDASGGDTAVGRGRCLVGEWSAGTARTLDARRRYVTTILDAGGAQHAIWAVQNELGEWTYRIGPVDDAGAETVPAGQIPAPGDSVVDVLALPGE